MIVISDASPLIGLSAIGHLDLLPALYGRVVVPRGVFAELTARGESAHGAAEVATADWIDVVDVPHGGLLKGLPRQLGRGESEAISLAVLRADGDPLLLIDELRGREVARRMRVRTIGVLGVIVEAKGAGLVASARDLLDGLANLTTFRISGRLRAEVLKLAGEA